MPEASVSGQAKAGRKGRVRAGRTAVSAGVPGPSRLAQVRLRTDEMETLRDVMRTLNLESTSDALRAGLRLLAQEAAELRAAEDIRSFYGGLPAPVPDGVILPDAAELAAADTTAW